MWSSSKLSPLFCTAASRSCLLASFLTIRTSSKTFCSIDYSIRSGIVQQSTSAFISIFDCDNSLNVARNIHATQRQHSPFNLPIFLSQISSYLLKHTTRTLGYYCRFFDCHSSLLLVVLELQYLGESRAQHGNCYVIKDNFALICVLTVVFSRMI